jgi:nickel/cobalt exporter
MELTRREVRWTSVLVLLFPLFLGVGKSLAHPMGNFSVNHYGKIKIKATSVELLYLIDMAEIPTYQEMREFGITATTDDPGALHYLDVHELRLKQGLTLESDGRRVELATISRHLQFANGAGGLPTMKLLFAFRGKLDSRSGAHKLTYDDHNFPGRAGWKEIVVLSDGTEILQSSAKETDRSKELTNYSTDLLNSPPQQLSAVVEFRTAPPGSNAQAQETRSGTIVQPRRTHGSVPEASAIARLAPHAVMNKARQTQRPSVSGQTPPKDDAPAGTGPFTVATSQPRNTPHSAFTELISRRGDLGFWFLLSAALIAAGLGALHALEPGHGKTIVAAYLVGSHGTARHAVLLGIVVTAAHTAGVYLLGLVTLYASRYIVPEQLYPWLGSISGVTVAGLGVFMLLKHWSGETGDHSHVSGENHSHWFLSMFKTTKVKPGTLPSTREISSPSANCNERGKTDVSLRELCLLGITGGIVPCPAALVVLLSAFSLHRIGFGLFLITAFSIGLAVVLVVVGLTMVYGKRFIASRLRTERAFVRFLPILSSAFMIVLGIGIAVSALISAPVGLDFVSKEKLFPFVTVTLLGLFLGMRHSTDPDHVVAVTTIVSRQRSIKSSASIGLLWGLGHTLTIFLVGSAIIIFGVVIPPRLGLSMEFCVALMLILLGILNLTGITKSITERSTPKSDLVGVAAPAVSGGHILIGNACLRPGLVKRIEGAFGNSIGRLGLYQTVRPLAIGLVHGLAGSAAVALLVLSTIKSPFWATAYLLVFGFGTMLGMMVMTTAMSVPLIYAGNRFFKINAHLATISGIASMAFGMFLVYHIGLVDGLFLARPHWIPQ